MPKPFLYDVAKDIVARYGEKNERLTFVFPNKRASLFFKKYLMEIIGQTVWSPKFFTINQITDRYTNYEKPNQLALLFYLYESFQEIKLSRGKWDENFTFDKFSNLGEIILSDFNDIDNYLASPTDVFGNIKDLAEIEQRFFYLSDEEKEVLRRYWSNFTVDKLSREKELFLELFEDMPLIYQNFNNRLQDQNLSYPGMASRKLAELIAKGEIPPPQYGKYIFVGFSALNAVERQLFHYFDQKQQAEFYWDTDEYYIKDKDQEAGLFLRKNLKAYTADYSKLTNNLTLPRVTNKPDDSWVKVIGVPLHATQAKLIPRILKMLDLNPADINEKTVIVLANEHLLFSVLQAIPPEVKTLNVTMGYPLKETSLFALTDKLIDLHTGTWQSKNAYHHRSVSAILRHPLVRELETELCDQLLSTIVKQNLNYVPINLLLEHDSKLLRFIFEPLLAPSLFIERMLDLLYLLFTKGQDRTTHEAGNIEQEYIYWTYVELKKIDDTLKNHAGIYSLTFLANVLRKALNEVKIPFTGEPLNGLQIMGVLETRNIDFEHVIVLGMNEGTWPSTSHSPSFVSEGLRQAFQLPVSAQLDAIFAYLFYRLLQRAKTATLVYNNLADGQNSGELSRLVLQLMYESNIKIDHHQFNQELKIVPNNSITIQKNAAILEKLTNYTAIPNQKGSGLTASAINTYLDCSLKFYFKYIVGIDEKDTVTEEIDAAILGTILHAVLEKLYDYEILQKQKSRITSADFKYFRSVLDLYIDKAFAETFRGDETQKFDYRNELIVMREVVRSLAEVVLKTDEKIGDFDLLALEKKDAYTAIIPVNTNGNTYNVRLKGIIDRVDSVDGIVRVLDYKTGTADKGFKDWEVVFSTEEEKRKKAVLQTFLYGLLYYENHPSPLFPGIYDVRSMTDSKFTPNLTIGERKGKVLIDANNFPLYLEEFKERIAITLTELYNAEVPFTQTEHKSHCGMCPFDAICARSEK